jgi:hypothetical protein
MEWKLVAMHGMEIGSYAVEDAGIENWVYRLHIYTYKTKPLWHM